LTFAEAAEKVRNGDCGHSQVAITDLGKVPAERLHPKAADSRCRPVPDIHCRELAAMKQSVTGVALRAV
jgi:hypothetical protein